MKSIDIITKKLKKINGLTVKKNIYLKDYTSFKVGGPADIFVIPSKKEALSKALTLINQTKIPVFILGSGSNIIVSDKGYRGIVIYMGKFNKLDRNDNIITAETGISLNRLTKRARDAELEGLEFASGIPGSLGGALYMNAGAYGSEMKDVVKNVLTVDHQGKFSKIDAENLNLSYRNSLLQKKDLIALQAEIELKQGDINEITAKMKELNRKRVEKQPLNWPSAGSIFKRPENDYAGRLVETANMKGKSIGGAQVSKKHAGFIINKGNATAQDIKDLIELVRKKVYEISDIWLETEPKFIGEE